MELLKDDTGSATVEYAGVALVGVAFVSVLLAIVNSDLVSGLLQGLMQRVLSSI